MDMFAYRRLFFVACLAFAQGNAFAQENLAASTALNALPVSAGNPRIVLMLQKDVGQEALNPIDPDVLKRLSLKVGIDLVWEANTRTNGQVLSLPFAVTAEQARQAAKALSLEPGILWADVEAGETHLKPKSAIAKNSNHRTDEISRFIVKLRGDNLSSDLDSGLLTKLATAAGVKLKATDRTSFARILSLEEPITLEQAEAIEISLERLSEVVYADPESHVSTQNVSSITPNDPYFWRDWHLLGPYPPSGVPPYGFNGYLGAANVQAAWELTKGSASTGVAVVDSGILFDHPDLKRSLGRQKTKRGWDMITSIASARDGNARDQNAQDEGDWVDAFTGCGDALRDSTWHGSHVAGIIAATTNNSVGVSGINWKAKIVPVRAIGACGNLSDMTDGIIWAAGNKEVPGTKPNRTPVKVINLSLGGDGACSNAEQEAIDYALSKGISVVVSAGNESKDVSLASPANCRGVISVASVNHLGDLADYSNFGSSITVSAPGGQMQFPVSLVDPVSGKEVGAKEIPVNEWGVWSTINTSPTSPNLGKMTYGPMQGTSMSAPVVSGVVSLMVSADKKHRLSPTLVKKILQDTAAEFIDYTPNLEVISGSNPPVFEWLLYRDQSRCTTTLLGKCGAGVVDAEAAVEAVLELQ